MRKSILLVIALILGLTTIVVGARQQSPVQSHGKEKAASCCTKSAESCCMGEHKSGDAQAAHIMRHEQGRGLLQCQARLLQAGSRLL